MAIVLFVSLLSLAKLLLFFHDTKFFHFIFLIVSLSFFFSSFENSKCDLPQLEHPKGAKTHNVMWHPKVAEVNNNIRRLKAAKSNNAIVNVFCTFLFFFNFLVVNPTKHNNQHAFHLDFTSTLKIGQSQLPIFLVR
jgi:hypothetical protein